MEFKFKIKKLSSESYKNDSFSPVLADHAWKILLVLFSLGIVAVTFFGVREYISIDSGAFLTEKESASTGEKIDNTKLEKVLKYFNDKATKTEALQEDKVRMQDPSL